MYRELKVFIRTLADIAGLTKLGQAIHAHSAAVRLLTAGAVNLGKLGGAGVRLIGAEFAALRNAALAAAGALAVAAREGAKFNISLVPAVNMFSGNRLANFSRFRREILDLSSDLGIARDQLVKVLYTGGSAQLTAEQTILAIRKAAQGVKADGADINEVFLGIIAGVKAFGGDINETAEMLYKIVQLGQTTFGEVGSYLSQVGPVAAANNVSLGETGAAIATLTAKTIPLSQAVNQIRNMMSKLNMELGDGWRQSYNFQDAMEAVAKSVVFRISAVID